VVMALQTLVGIAETYFVSRLGTDAVAGVALVFPVFMLMTMMSNGGIGGGVSAAMARAIGGGRMQDADALVTHAVVIGLIFGAIFTAATWSLGPQLFQLLGAENGTLANALLYANVLFTAAVPGWIANLLGAALRGAGNVLIPALVTSVGSLVTLALSPLLIFGWGVIPALGVAGAGVALIIFNVGSLLALWLYLRSSGAPISLHAAPLERRHFEDILRVGVVSAIGTIVTNLTIVVITGLVGQFGRDAIAGFGLASRLDYILIPIMFAIGTATITMVGTNTGAGHHKRARSVAWVATALSIAITGVIGCTAALWPQVWIGLFTDSPQVIAAGSAYLVRVAPFYVFTGLGMALFFASQGAGHMLWPFTAGILRLVTAIAVGGYWVAAMDGTMTGLFWVVALSQVIFGMVNVLGFASASDWGHAQHSRSILPTTSLKKA